MNISGQGISANKLIEQKESLAAIVKSIHMEKGTIEELHSHSWHQLIFPIRGLIQTQADRHRFLVPHTTAIIVPAGIEHKSNSLTETVFIGVYINPQHCRNLHQEITSVIVSIFMRELILTLKHECQSENLCNAKIIRLIDVLHDQLQTNKSSNFSLLLPKDRRIKIIFEQLITDPSISYTLDEWSSMVGATKRTLTRLFTKEFGTSFSLWRQNLRLICSLALLENNHSIQEVSHKVGYQNDSSYIKAFKTRFGLTPKKFKTQRRE